jgi:hypothetical protein
MDRLYSMSGVEEVGFEKTQRASQPGTAGGASTDCNGSKTASSFSLVTYFKETPETAAAAALAGGTAAPAAPDAAAAAAAANAGKTTPPAAAEGTQPAAPTAGATTP